MQHTTILQTPSPPVSNSIEPLLTALRSQNGAVLLACLLGLGVLSLLQGRRKSTLATGRWAGRTERRRAQQKAQQQIRLRCPNQAALTTGLPSDQKAFPFPDMQRSMAVVGQPGVGKTKSIIDPMLVSALSQGFPLIVFDYKYPAQASRIIPLAKSLRYSVNVFAPGFKESACCNPLDLMSDANDVDMTREFARVLHLNTQRSDGTHSSDPFFTEAGEQANVAGLTLAKSTPYPDLVMVHAILSLSNLPDRLKQATTLPLWAKLNFEQLASLVDAEKTSASIIGTATGTLTRMMSPATLNAFTGTTTLPLDLNGRQLIVLGMDQQRQAAIAPLIATVLHMLVVRNMSLARTLPLVVSLDEVATLRLPSLVRWINEYRERGLVLILGFQNFAQLERTYNRPTARAIFGACGTKVIFNPGEPESAQQFSAYLGEEELNITQVSRSRGNGKTSINRTKQQRTRKLFEPSQFLKLPTGTAIVLSPGLSTKRESTLPLKHAFRISSQVSRLITASEQHWPQIQQQLVPHTTQLSFCQADIEARQIVAEQLLPAPNSNP